MKTISIRLEDSIYEELGTMLDMMGQTKQNFYEEFTRAVLKERRIPFIIKYPMSVNKANTDRKLEAFARLEISRKKSTDVLDYNKERSEALDEKYGDID